MKTLQIHVWPLLVALLLWLPLNARQGAAPDINQKSAGHPELDAYWAELSRTVSEGDFEVYSAGYHPDAVLVSLGEGRSYPISEALAGWKPGFDDTKAGKTEAGVEFRFTQRLKDTTTAHETGMFRYWSRPSGGTETVFLVHFQALLVKQGGWKMVMEYQMHEATQAEWDEAG